MFHFQYLPKDNAKRRVVMVPIMDKPFAVVFCIIAAKIQEDTVIPIVHECSLCVPRGSSTTLFYVSEIVTFLTISALIGSFQEMR